VARGGTVRQQKAFFFRTVAVGNRSTVCLGAVAAIYPIQSNRDHSLPAEIKRDCVRIEVGIE